MKITVYNDQPELLHPFTHMRPTWDVIVGGRTLKTFLANAFPEATIEFKDKPFPSDTSEGVHLSGRALPTDELIKQIRTGERPFAPTLDAPWKLITYHKQILTEELERRIQTGNYTEIRPNVFCALPPNKGGAGGGCTLNDSVITDTQNGPIIIESNVTLGHHIVLTGPTIIEKDCTIKNFADIRNSYIGLVCKIGGEVSGTNFFGYSNKTHHGFVGDSAVAEWVNFGGGSTTSNMKNTYGPVRIQKYLADEDFKVCAREETNLTFLGALIGDHTKIAVSATLYTGTMLGVATHPHGIAQGSVPSFTQVYGDQRAELPLEVAHKIAQRAMARRDVELSEEHKNLLSEVFKDTQTQRDSIGAKKDTKLSF